MQSIPRDERVAIGADFNGHAGEGNRGDEVMGRFGIQDLTILSSRRGGNIGGRSTQMDYTLCR